MIEGGENKTDESPTNDLLFNSSEKKKGKKKYTEMSTGYIQFTIKSKGQDEKESITTAKSQLLSPLAYQSVSGLS